jgi:DNA-binding HxlR family transcriptional regulator
MAEDTLDRLIARLMRTGKDIDATGLRSLAQAMAETGRKREDPVREIMSRLGDRWSPLILFILNTGAYRHAALRRTITLLSAEQAISQRMLTLRLRALERDGLVLREVEPTSPPTVTYRLSVLGRGLAEKLDDMVRWIKLHESEIAEARAAFSE